MWAACDKRQLLEAVILPRILLVTPGSFVEIQKLDICVALPARWLSPVNSAIGFHLWHLSSSSLQYPILKKTKTNTKIIQRQRLSLVNSNINQPTIPDPQKDKDKYKDDTKTNITILSSVQCPLSTLLSSCTSNTFLQYPLPHISWKDILNQGKKRALEHSRKPSAPPS